MRNYTHSLALMAAVSVGGLALFLAGFFVALAVRSALADPGGPVPNPGHAWIELQDHGVSGSDYWLGTTDSNALELWVNNARALRLEPNSTSPNVIGGYSGNSATTGVAGAAIGGGGSGGNTNRVTDDYCTISGGQNNQAGDNAGSTSDRRFATVGGGGGNTASGPYATVGGGNTNTASNQSATVSGGSGNAASGDHATVGGGGVNTASGVSATVGGGDANTAGGGTNATVGGGHGNIASGTNATVGGGYHNTSSGGNATVGGGHDNEASSDQATVGGGENNTASGVKATVSGGGGNTASGGSSTVGGGQDNDASGVMATVGGGQENAASGESTTVGGGYHNTASGLNATVPGGASNTADGDWSFAAGHQAKANNQGCFVWGDVTDSPVECNDDNRFIARAGGGVYLYTSGDLSTGAYLASGSGSWTDLSDRNLKDNFTPVDGQDVLARLAEIPIATWNYKAQDDSIRHMGPAAQDFAAAFGLGESDTGISTVDADGVALAAIQGLQAENAELRRQLGDLETRVSVLEGGAGTSGAGATSGPFSGLTAGWLALGGLAVVAGLVLVQRRRAGGER